MSTDHNNYDVVTLFDCGWKAAPEYQDQMRKEIQELVRSRLSQHEYPRHVAFVAELPKTPAGKVHRKQLRDRELQRS